MTDLPIDRVQAWLETSLGLAPQSQVKLLATFGVVLLLWLVRRLVLRVMRSRTEDPRVRYRWKKISSYIAVTLGLLALVRIWFGGVTGIATYLGLLSAGVAIALKDPLVNLAGWAFILWRRPFEVGDRIQVGDVAGDVIDQRIFQFTLMEIGNWVAADQSTGRIVHVPNGWVFTDKVANYTHGFRFIWNEIPILVTFESDWRKAKTILERVLDEQVMRLSETAAEEIRRAARRYLIFYSKLTPRVYTSVEDSGVLLTLRYLCDARTRRGTSEQIWEDVLDAFAASDDIDFAYPTTRFYGNVTEGKPGARAAPPPPFPEPPSKASEAKAEPGGAQAEDHL